MIITIDGPAGSGKSSVAKKIAKELGFYFLYTGLLYRAVAYIWLYKLNKKLEEIRNLSFCHPELVSGSNPKLDKDLEFISQISYEYIDEEPQIIYKQENITKYLYDMSLSNSASIMSALKNVRTKLLDIQRNVAKKYDIVAEGRDCGSVIFPTADYKFFLTANLDVRAKRVYEDKRRGNIDINLKEVKVELEKRDARDSQRDVAPLTIPKNAIIIDNSDLSEKETLEKFLSYISREL